MASILARNVLAPARSLLPRVSCNVRPYSDKVPPLYDPAEGKRANPDLSMPDKLGGAVGIERWELIERAKGNDDPFLLGGLKITPGTKEKPTIIPTVSSNRTIACVCEEDSVSLRFTRMFVGETKRCQCGHYFKLVGPDDVPH